MALFAFLLSSCSAEKIAREWAIELEQNLRCNMTVEEIDNRWKIQKLEPTRAWRTHFIEHQGTFLWLEFVDGKLQSSQIEWVELPTRTATFQRLDYCDTTGDPLAVYRLPKNH